MTTTANRRQIALIGLGEVGQVLAADLHAKGSIALSAWDCLFSSSGRMGGPSRAVRTLAFLREATSMADAVRGSAVAISAVTAAECLSAARQAAPALVPGTFYFDLNSVSPATRAEAAHLIDGAGGRYVEAAVMSTIGLKRIASPMWLGGPHAHQFLPLAQSLGFTGTGVYSETIGAASAVKMCRSVVVKGMEALLTESLLAARHYRVEDAVLASLNDLLPANDWHELARYMVSRSLQHGERRAEEMREVARTVVDAGLEPWMSRSCVERQRWAAQYRDAVCNSTLAGVLDAVLADLPVTEPPGAAVPKRVNLI